MGNLIHPKDTIEILKKYEFSFSKRFGQNFLIDEHVLSKIIASAEITTEDTVLEVGPGIGTMTQALCENAGQVYAIEIDDKLIPILKDTLSAYDNVQVIHEDVLKVDLKALSEQNGNKTFKVVANLPYYITTPILMNLLERDIPVSSITVMVQKEVAMRMQAKPGTKDYGALSLAVQYYSEPYLVANVPQNSFMPRPDVSSAVIRLKKYKHPIVKVADPQMMFKVIRASFNQRRKTLVNGVSNSGELSFKKDQIIEVLKKMGLPENVRGETLSLSEFAEFTDLLCGSDS